MAKFNLNRNYELKKIYSFYTQKYLKEGNGIILTLVVDEENNKFYYVGELPLHKKVNLRVTKIYRRGGLKLVANENSILDKDVAFPVLNIVSKKKNNVEFKYFVVEGETNKKLIPFLSWQYSQLYQIPLKLTCTIREDNPNTLLFQRISDENKHPIFEKGKEYIFKLVKTDYIYKNRIEKKFFIALGPDSINYKIPAHECQEESDFKNREISAVFIDYKSNGELILRQNSKFFINYRKVFSQDLDVTALMESFEGFASGCATFNQMLLQYEQLDNRWILTFAKALDELYTQLLKKGEFHKSLIALELLFTTEKFIATSSYPRLFSDKKQTALIQKGNTSYIEISQKLECIKLISNNSYHDFISDYINRFSQLALEEKRKFFFKTIDILTYAYNVIPENQILTYIFDLGYLIHDNNLKDHFNHLKSLTKVRFQHKEITILSKTFFNSKEKSDFYRNNEELRTLINYYLLLYHISIQLSDSAESDILLSKIIRCIALYLFKEDVSQKLLEVCLLILYKEIKISLPLKWKQQQINDLSVDILTQSNEISHPKNLFKETSQKLITNTTVTGVIHQENSNGYCCHINDFSCIISQDSILPFEVNYFFNSKIDKPNFSLKAIDHISKNLLVRFNRESSHIFKRLQIEKLSPGKKEKGIVKRILPHGAIIELGGIDGFLKKIEVAWGPVSFIEDYINEGSVYDFLILETKSVSSWPLQVSLKKCTNEPFQSIDKRIPFLTNGRFLRFIGLEYIYDKLKIEYNKTLEIEYADCPICHKTIGDNKNLKIDKLKKSWKCKCGYHGEEVYLFRSDIDNITVSITKKEIKEEEIESIQSLKPGDEILLKIIRFDNKTKFINAIVENKLIIKNNRKCVFYNSSSIDKDLNKELAKVYEDIAGISIKLKEEFNYLLLSQHYYSRCNEAKSYYYNTYLSLLEIQLLIEQAIEKKMTNRHFFKTIKDKAKEYKDAISEKTLQNYSSLQNHSKVLEYLSLIQEPCAEANYKLFQEGYAKIDDHYISSKLARIILAYNAVYDSEEESEIINMPIILSIYSLLKEGLIKIKKENLDINEEILESNNKKRKNLFLLINKGEGKTIEFKSSLFSPILEDKKKTQIVDLENKLNQEPSIDKKNQIKQQIQSIKGSATENDIKHSVMKEIAAFANSIGGTLLIGVNDYKEIIGLDADFSKISKVDKCDGFKLKFDEITKEYLGESIFPLITTDFIENDGKFVFQVIVRDSTEFIWLLKDKSGQPKETIYIRAESSTRQLEGKALAAFIKSRQKAL